jgi:hypothetical protein
MRYWLRQLLANSKIHQWKSTYPASKSHTQKTLQDEKKMNFFLAIHVRERENIVFNTIWVHPI